MSSEPNSGDTMVPSLTAERPWRPAVTVATVVERGGRFLFVEERIRGELRLNQPAGHLDPGESLVEAAVRETREETAWRVRITGLVGVYQWTNPDDGAAVVRFTFAAQALSEMAGAMLDHGIERVLWLSAEEFEHGPYVPRTPLVALSLADFRAGRRASLDLLHAQH
jgi:8-oxo-dGTP pyrophosphatase MutT (NUDIX family)